MISAPVPARESPTQPVRVDAIGFWDYFEYFCDRNRISIVLEDAHREICDLYEAAVTGDMPGYEYFIVNMPRRIGKTKILEALASWQFGEFETSQMLYGCYSDTLVKRSIAYVKHTMMLPWYIDLFGDKVHTGRTELVTTTAGGSLYGAGTCATVTGFGAGLKEPAGGFIALDDPANPNGAQSPVETKNVIENFELVWKGCRNSDRWCPIIVNCQRIGPNDLPGYIETTYPNRFYKLKIPCVVGFGETARSRFPDTWSMDSMRSLQNTRIGRYVYASQFQQEPIALGGNLIPIDEFVRWDPSTARSLRFEQLVITIDTALKVKQANDFSAVELWGLLGGKVYLIDLMHGQWEGPALIANITAFWKLWSQVPDWPMPDLLIEEKAAGTTTIQILNQNGIPAQGIERNIDKVQRVQGILQFIETHLVVVPQDNSTPWIGKFLTECAEFTKDGTHAHDDMCDPLVDAIERLIGKPTSIYDVLLNRK